MSEDSEALIREIDEEVRREKLTKLWTDYGTYLIAGVAALVVLVGGLQWYTAYTADRAQKSGGRFDQANEFLEGDKKKDGVAILENLSKEGTPAYAMLAKLRLAGAHRSAGEDDKAAALYELVANDTSADDLFRSFAKLQIASLKVDSGSWTEAQNRLKDLANDAGPWRHTAKELLGLAAYKHKKWSDARQAYSSLLIDQGVPPAMKQRAQTALALITREEAVKPKPLQKDAAQPDLKKDKSASNGDKSSAEAVKPAPKPSDGAGAKDDADDKK